LTIKYDEDIIEKLSKEIIGAKQWITQISNI
jgi:hypothetical protein